MDGFKLFILKMFKLHILTEKDSIRREHLDSELQPSVRNWKTCQQRQSIMSWMGSQSTLTAPQNLVPEAKYGTFSVTERKRQTPNRESKPLCKCRIPNPVLSHSTRPAAAETAQMPHGRHQCLTQPIVVQQRSSHGEIDVWKDGPTGKKKRQIFVTQMMRRLSECFLSGERSQENIKDFTEKSKKRLHSLNMVIFESLSSLIK